VPGSPRSPAGSSRERTGAPAWQRYLAAQVPGAVLVGVGLWLFWGETGLPSWMGVVFFVFWIGKDVLLYPLMRRAYESSDVRAQRVVGARGVARSALATDGQVEVRGETWRARAVEGEDPIGAGDTVIVRGVDRYTLLVARER
jgi:membrane protein implicated in regulation of membrane protease activity